MRIAITSLAVVIFCGISAAAERASPFTWTSVPPETESLVVGGHPYVQEGAGNPWSLQRAEKSASHILRFEVRAGDHWSEDQSSGENKERSELDGYKVRWTGKMPVWVAYSFLIEPGELYQSSWTSVAQMAGNEARPFFVLYKGDELSIIAERPGASGPAQKQVYAAKLSRGEWHNVVYKLVQSSADDGGLKAWLDGHEIVDYHGPLGSNTNNAYWKFGVYRGYGPIATPIAVEYANMEVTGADLSRRVSAPLEVH